MGEVKQAKNERGRQSGGGQEGKPEGGKNEIGQIGRSNIKQNGRGAGLD